uniref:Uncharacterized protein n=1 Tax=Fagus sylvatica TaxID=28930 RepID=A0A2N9HJ45_FAGSY
MAVIPVETAVLVSWPFIRVRHQLSRPLQSRVVSDLHEYVIYRSVHRGKMVESLIKSPSTLILMSPIPELLIKDLVLPGEFFKVGGEAPNLSLHHSHFWELATGGEQACVDIHRSISRAKGWKTCKSKEVDQNWHRFGAGLKGFDAFVTLSRPTLAQVWRHCVLSVHRLPNHQYTHYIQPELLFHHSFGPEPSDVVLTLLQTNEKRAATMKINKSKLKNMVEKGAPVAPKASTTQAPPSVPSTPPIIQIPNEEITIIPATDDGPTICWSHGLVAKRAEAAITELDFQEYANARTENISRLMVHSLMRRLAKSEASQKNLNWAVFELNKEKRDLVGEVEAVKVDLIAKEDDVKAAVEARDKAVKEMKHLMGQVEGARAAAMSDYKAFKAFEENNLQCFYSGFEAFRKQAKVRCPDIDFTGFQPYDNTDSINEGNEKGDDTDDATT